MTREGALLIFIGIAVALVALGVLAWRRRTRRDRGLRAPTGDAPVGARRLADFDGLYVATTPSGRPLERLAIRGLAFRSRAGIVVTDRGLALDLTGQPRLFLTADRIVAVAQATVAIDRVVERDGLVRVSWRTAEDVVVDSYLRAQETSAATLADAIAQMLPAAPTAADPTPPTTPTTPRGNDA